MKITILFALATLASCAAKQFTGPDGRLYYESECNHVVQNCYKKAGKTCPNGYNITNEYSWTERSGRAGLAAAGAAAREQPRNVVIITNGGPDPYEQKAFKITYECK